MSSSATAGNPRATAPPRSPNTHAFFGFLYYAGMRLAEVVALRAGDCELPTSGWGRLQLARSEPWAGQEWTDNGEARERRMLKRRASSQSGPCRSQPSWSVCSAHT